MPTVIKSVWYMDSDVTDNYMNIYGLSGGCLFLQEAVFPYGVGGKACSHDFYSSGMQHRPNPGTWLLLEGTTEQSCKIYNHVLLVSSFHIAIHEALCFTLINLVLFVCDS